MPKGRQSWRAPPKRSVGAIFSETKEVIARRLKALSAWLASMLTLRPSEWAFNMDLPEERVSILEPVIAKQHTTFYN